MEAETSQHDILPEVRTGDCIGSRSDGAAEGLENEGDEVAGAEYEGVCAGLEAGEVGAVDDDDAGEAQIDGSGEEGGGYCQGYETGGESVLRFKRRKEGRREGGREEV